MLRKNDVYKCATGTVAEILSDGGCADITCCGEKMEKLEAKTAVAEGKEKHVPVVEADGSGTKVTVGSVPHPMEEDHFIQWIEIINGDYVNRKYLKPGEKPEASFYVPMSDKLVVREYCNKHGLWQA